jgi:hypothetical protein
MNQKIVTFIFVHDQKIVIDYINHKKFKNLSNLKFVLVGNRDFSKIQELENVIICRDLPINIENYPKLTSFTGWYAIWKNGLYKDYDYLNLFEYDVNVTDDFEDIQSDFLSVGVIGYIPLSVRNPAYVRVGKWANEIIESIKKTYDVNVIDVVESKENDFNCSVTSNHTFSRKNFESYMEWVDPLIDDIKNLEMSGHQIERSISFFYLINNLEFKILPTVLEHFQFDSHETQGISKNKFYQNYDRLFHK